MDTVTYRFCYGSPTIETWWIEMPGGVPLGALLMMGREGRSALRPPLMKIECCFGHGAVVVWDGIDPSPLWLRTLRAVRVWAIVRFNHWFPAWSRWRHARWHQRVLLNTREQCAESSGSTQSSPPPSSAG